MLKRFTFWLWLAVIFQLLTGAIHSVGLFITPTAANDTERQLINLMLTYKLDMGAGFHRSMWDLFRALSSCYSLLCLLGGLTNIYLLKKRVAGDIVKGLAGIQVLVFGICFGVIVALTFLPPIVLTGLIEVSLLGVYLTSNRTSTT
ncbi:MAG: hypothetical protein C5B55_13920 [Blastocatellia bacterium]|nr:MAG: hypothetical protein C5B55_13920 [Blastocatellia bacterium]